MPVSFSHSQKFCCSSSEIRTENLHSSKLRVGDHCLTPATLHTKCLLPPTTIKIKCKDFPGGLVAGLHTPSICGAVADSLVTLKAELNPASFGVLDCFGEKMTGWEWQRHGFLEEKRWGYCDWWWQRSRQNEAILRCSRSIPEKKLTHPSCIPALPMMAGIQLEEMTWNLYLTLAEMTPLQSWSSCYTTHWSEWFWAWNCASFGPC